jgi:hypothetical protein
MLAIMFRLGLGLAHGAIMQSPISGVVTDSSLTRGNNCGPTGEQNSLQLLNLLCPVCHALSSADELDTGINTSPIEFSTSSSAGELTAAVSESVPAYRSHVNFWLRAPPYGFFFQGLI